MYLLKRLGLGSGSAGVSSFTFHYVSIKTSVLGYFSVTKT